MRATLHHIGVVVAEIGPAVAAYIADFGYEIHSPASHDPVQTVFYQFLRLPGDSTYLELVAPDGPESKLANALKKRNALNHVCYAVDDIEDACRILRDRGSFLIQEPQPAIAFKGRRIAWLLGGDAVLVELVERGPEGEL
jgi:methylmalonyl-CoA/ethylmalonyl-CoA epimerase